MRATLLWCALPIPAVAIIGTFPTFASIWVALICSTPIIVPTFWILRDTLR